MAVLLTNLHVELNQLLCIDRFQDYGPNGLQVAGKAEVQTIVTAVTASQEAIDQAHAHQADVLLVHHGLIWGREPLTITGLFYQRLKTLLQHNIALLAYHLPLDAHPVYGNNICLANKMGWEITGPLLGFMQPDIGCMGSLKLPQQPEQISASLKEILGNPIKHIAAKKPLIHRIAWCTGAAQDGIVQAAEQGADAYITGEISERTVYLARELNIHFFAAGHHATERYGVQSLGKKLAKDYDLIHHYVELDNPV
jgi:dinuclear metal center YbgI/SA1388 family protein